jgi:HpcH/HpaI aldolase/citrate lyase family
VPVKGFGDDFRLTLLTDDPAVAAIADSGGVDRIGIDLECLGKAERQSGFDTRLSNHRVEDLPAIAGSLARAELFVRINPINAETAEEVEAVLGAGAQVVMLPYFRTAEEVETFVRLIDGRASTMILLETASAVVRIREILEVPGVSEVMVGLNDLRLELGVQNHFEVLASPLLEAIANEVKKANLPFSVGGVARPDDCELPVAPDLVLAQFPRLGATGAWISRSFLQNLPDLRDFAQGVKAIRQRLTEWGSASPAALEHARKELAERARELARGSTAKRRG